MIEKQGRGQKPIEGGSWKQTPQPVMSKPGFVMMESSQAVVGNMSGGKDLKQSKVMKDRPGSGS